MNTKILAAVALIGAALATPAQAENRRWQGGGHWSHDSRGGGARSAAPVGRFGPNGFARGGQWNHDSRAYYGNSGWSRGGGGWNHGSNWHGASRWEGGHAYGWRPAARYHGGWGYAPYYSYAPRYYVPYDYAPGYYAPVPWDGWLNNLGLVIQFHLP
ncbi:MAG: hypothetical protein JSS24_10445 [Proteobacteria bacterium]|nr:hypothetical protein [Pseudomonadota bacterium]